MAYLKDVAEACEWNYSHGNMTERPFKNSVVYPLLHANIQNVSVYQSYASITVNVAIIDRVNFLKTEDAGLNKTTLYGEYGYTENQNYAHVLQELYVRFLVKLYTINVQNYNEITYNYPLSGSPFVEEAEDVVAGWSFTLTLSVHSPFATDGRC
jgi:hypothetical protein